MKSTNINMFMKILLLQLFLNSALARYIINQNLSDGVILRNSHKVKRYLVPKGQTPANEMLRRLDLTDEFLISFPPEMKVDYQPSNNDKHYFDKNTDKIEDNPFLGSTFFEGDTLNVENTIPDEDIRDSEQSKIDFSRFLRRKISLLQTSKYTKLADLITKIQDFRTKRAVNTKENKAVKYNLQNKYERISNKTSKSKSKRELSYANYYNGTYNYTNKDPQNLFGNIGEDLVDWQKYLQNGMTSGQNSQYSQLNSVFGWGSSGTQTTTASPNLMSRVGNFLTAIPSAVVGFLQNMASFLLSFTG